MKKPAKGSNVHILPPPPTNDPEFYHQVNGWGTTEDDIIRNMNRFYAFITEEVKIMQVLEDGTIKNITLSTFYASHAHHLFAILGADGKPKEIDVGHLWFKSNRKRIYKQLVFTPHAQPKDDIYNLWEGFKITPKEGDVQPFLDYVKEIICSENEEHYTYLIALLAQMFQKPGDKPGIAVVLRGEEGVGKSFFVERLCDLIAPYYFKSSNPKHIFGDHNSQLRNKIILHIEEAEWSGTKGHERQLRDIITGQEMSIHEKWVAIGRNNANYIHVFITGNPDRLVSVGTGARRIFAMYVSNKRIRDNEYFGNLDKEFKGGMDAALLHYFLHYDYNGVNLRKAPDTEELVHHKKRSLSGVLEYLNNLAETGEMPAGKPEPDGGWRIAKRQLYRDYCAPHKWRYKLIRMSEDNFGREFTSLLPDIQNGVAHRAANGKVTSIVKDRKTSRTEGKQLNAYIIPPLKAFRELIEFDLEAIGKMTWKEKDQWTLRV
jgi:hypothetical protein